MAFMLYKIILVTIS